MKKIAVLILTLLLCAGGYYGEQAYKSINIINKNSLNKKPIYKNSPKVLSKQIKNRKSINLLLLGVDTGALGRKFKGRSDTIMLLTLNPKTQKSMLMSIPRDMNAIMPGQDNMGSAKINTAYLIGGPQAMRKCIQQHFDVPIDGYAIVNMGGVEAMLKAVHGVRVKSNLTFEQDWYHFKKGHTYHLHGKKALAYIRARHSDPLGDYGRQIRQRQVLKALAKKMMKPKVILNHRAIKEISRHVHSDLTKDDLIGLGLNYRECLNKMKSTHVQGQSKEVYNMNYGLMEIENVDAVQNQQITNKILKQMRH